MRSKKAILEKSHEVLIEKAEDLSNLAKAQRETADKQHESAHKLEKLGRALEADAAEIKSELETDDGLAKPGLQKRPNSIPSKAVSS
jgi:hypothetical protein